MIYQINKQLLLESAFHIPRMIVMKGNPKYYIKPQSKIFYKTLKDLANRYGFKYEEYESDIWADQIKNYKSLNMSDIVIGFSRGCWYAKILKNKLSVNTNYIGIGCHSTKDEPQELQLKNPLDFTSKDDMSKNSIKNHWIITTKMKQQLSKKLRKIKGLK